MAADNMRVLLFAGRFQVRGSSAYTLRLAEQLGENGISARIVCSDASWVESGRREKLPIQEYPHMQLPVWGRIVMAAMLREFSGDVPDLIHVQSRHVSPHGACLARWLKCPSVLTVHDYLSPREQIRFDPRWGKRIIAVSESVKSGLLGHITLPDSAVQVIHSGVEVTRCVDSLPVLDPGHVPVIGTAGPLEAVKGLPFFLGAAQKLLATGRNVEFVVSGTGPEERNLRRIASSLGITDHVTFVPNLFDFSQSLAAMDVFCLPSLRQGLGTIMLEAMALGKPVIATGVGGVYSAVQDDKTGLMVPPSDSRRLAERMIELLMDPVRARAIGEAGRKTVQNQFSVQAMVSQTAELYREVLAEMSKEKAEAEKV